MKQLILLLCLALPVVSIAQKLQATEPDRIYQVGSQKAPLYRSAADTAKEKIPYHLEAGSNATVVGHFSPRWLVVKRQGFFYLTPSALLFSPDGPTRLLDGTVLPFDLDTKRITYQGVIEVPGATKDQLYVRAYEWLAKTYRSANAVIQMQDKEAGRLVGKGVTKITIKGYNAGAGYVQHTITIYLKDGRYKYVLTDFVHEAGGTKDIYSAGPLERPDGEIMAFGDKKTWDKVRRDAMSDAELLVKDLQAAMTLKGTKDPSDF